MTDVVLVDHAELRRFARQVLCTAGAPEAEAAIVADSLVDANLRGHDSHGVMRLQEYCDAMRRGTLVPGAQWTIRSETPASFCADAGLGFGQVQMVRLLEQLQPRAQALGTATGTLSNCGHIGRLGEWVERAARAGFAALLSVNDNGVLRRVAPPGGIEPRISTNPLALGVPTDREPLVLDISTSVVANGKVRVAELAGQSCPAGWLQDSSGEPSTDPAVVRQDPPGTILPMGGYKGFGLGLLLDILVGGLSGGYCPPAPDGAPDANNVLLVLWDPRHFAGTDHFQTQAATLIESVRNTRTKPGVTSIQLPGDRSAADLRQRTNHGIPIDRGTWTTLQALA